MNLDDIEAHLAPSPDGADALVDLSNVVRNDRFGGPHPRSLDRLGMVIEALARRTSDRRVRVHALADRSLRHMPREYPSPREPRLLADWIDRGAVVELPDVDGPLLELAEVTGLPVVSDDGFADFRELHPWIQGDTEHFLGVRPRAGGGVSVKRRNMGVRSPAEISRKVEESDLKAHRLLQGRERAPMVHVLKRSWRCPRRDCSLYDRNRGSRVRLPLMRGLRPVCEAHRVELVDDGPRPPIVQLKLMVDGACVQRFTLEQDTVVTVGRAPGEGGLALYGHLPGGLLARVSRSHLEATVRDGTVLVRNLSGNGTRVRRHGSPDWSPVSDVRATGLDINDVVELVPSVTLTRSARKYPPELARAWQAAAGRVPRDVQEETVIEKG
ncbi:hypothetical protein ABZ249_24665 [Nocardiopsis sp. NPDC006139]|uniref:hypothetical protein n=1 Tax=Nocardiopsis sp. NPDC006139 TaxID=3154578 RepID=UPI0033B42DBD